MQSYKEALQLFQKNSMNLPMTEHEDKLNIMLEYLLHELEKDKKELQMLRQEIIHESYLQSSINDDTSTSFIEEIADFTRNFRKLADQANTEINELSNQVDTLKNEKARIKKSANLLDHRVYEMEKVLGVGINPAKSQEANN
ncbi:unnamed protein product (macronuclear) [Paramecium tetraurelia]|uniref:Uncharacterized protein n=1 Tax=Paramecium tetraurelia TaxID=5888 RepID=A0CXD7_PARTE|nr:uncharacterized protein GSPATT00011086001 [Paramecium tetraurelia]CAK75454.1 unnamed protein product [Paramecium tetraurelia]|eukprot:XP_001442851.1 hypothetical protein (macronuclear) [Paramecium tetraurelia strain d4-2]